MTESSTNRSPYATDRWTTDDQLEFSDFCPALLDILTKADTPLTVGIFGPWGSGKTSLMRMLRDEIEMQPYPHTRTVWFTAWKYDRDVALWRAFILRVLDGLYPRANDPKELPRADRPRLPREQITDPTQRAAVEHLDRLAEALYGQVEWEEQGRLRLQRQFIKDVSNIGMGMALGPLSGILSVEPDATRWVGRQVQNHRMHQLSSMEQFERSFELALGSVLREDGRLIVFVDDLDRCLPEKAVEVLEAIKLFLEAPRTVFVLGMAPEIIEKGIEVRYRGLIDTQAGDSDSRDIDGNEYLQKIVQIPFYLPSLAATDLGKYLGDLEDACDQEAGMGMCPMTREVFAQGVLPNPRQVKRARNIFLLLQQISVRKEASGSIKEEEKVAWPLLAKTVLIQTQWPDLYRRWRDMPTLVRTLEEQYESRPSSEQEHILGRPRKVEGETEELTTGGLLDEFLAHRGKYALLERMLTYPKLDQAGSARERARFSGLTRQQMEVYVRLAGAVEQVPPAPVVSVRLPNELLSGDVARIKDALEQLLEGEREEGGPRHVALRQQLEQALAHSERPATERASAGQALAYLGDTRPEVMTVEGMQFCYVPAGPFWMGSDDDDPDAYGDEKPAHELDVPYDYWMGRYPVTGAQFRFFVQDPQGYRGDDWWTRDGLLWRGDRAGPAETGEPYSLPNHPVVNVTWYEALAFTRWLAARLRAAGKLPDGWGVRLPSEAEWEKSARGGIEIPADPYWGAVGTGQAGSLERNSLPKRRYPWGDVADPDRANYDKSGIGATSAVGCFAGGRSAYGCVEMSGNVWEWTRSLWGKKLESPDFKYPYRADDSRENEEAGKDVLRVLRGGSSFNSRQNVRCAWRGRADPYGFLDDYGFRVVVVPIDSEL